jgi:hypothetical protein
MKRLYKLQILIFLLTSVSLTSLAQVLTTTGVPPSLCERESFTLGFDFGGGVSGGNQYIAELSNASGSFISPVQIGSIASTDLVGTIYCTIPEGTPYGNGYIIRVLATNTTFGQVPVTSGTIDISCTTRDYYWLGGAGNWSDLSKWEYTTDDITYTPATELPTANDNVIFDDTTFPSGGQLTIDVTAYCNDLYWDPISAANNPIFYGESGGNSLNVRGDFILSPGVYREIWDLFFTSSKANIYLDFGDNQVDNVQDAWWKGFVDFRGGGSWDIGSDLIAENLGIYEASNIYTNDFTLDLEREIYLENGAFFAGASDIFAGSYGMYSFLDAGTSTFHIRTNRYSWWTHAINGSQTYFNVIIDGELTNIQSDNTYSNLSLINGGGMSVWRDTHQVINNSLNAVGSGRSQMAQIKTYQEDGGLHTINIGVSAAVTADYVAITDSEILGNGTPYPVTNGIDGGNNLNWNISALAPLAFYWSGGSGNWSDINHWNTSTDGGTTLVPASEGPGSIDQVYFNENSFAAGGTLTVDQNVDILSMTWEAGSGDNSPEIFSDYDYDFTVYGDLTMANGVIRNIRRLFLDTNGGTISLNTADNLGNHGDLTFRGGGVINLAGNLENRGWTYFDNATFNSNNFDLDLYAYDFTGSAIVNLGASNVYLDYYWYQNPSATIDFGTSTVIANRPNNNASEIYGTTAFNNFIVRDFAMFYENNSFNNLSIEAGGTLHIQSGNTLSVSNSFNLTGTRSEFATIDAFNGTNGTISVGGTVTADFVDISNNTIIPASTATSGINGGNNTGWTIGPLPALDFYWIGGSGNWTDPTHWATADGGSTLHGFAPASIDNVFFTSNSFPSGGTVTIDQDVFIHDVTWATGSGATNPEFFGDWGNRLTVTGNFTMANDVSRRIRELTFDSSDGTNQINMADNTNAQGNIEFVGGGIWDLQSDIIQENDFVFQDAGTFNTNNYNIEIGGFYIYNNTTFNLGTSDIIITYRLYNGNNNPIINDTNATFRFASTNDTYLRGPFTLSNIEVASNFHFEGNIDNTITNLTGNPGSTINIFAGTTQTITGALTLVGTQSSFVTVASYDYGTPGVGTFNAIGATVTANYTSLSDNTITPGATANNSIDGGNLTGWTITSPPSQDYYWINGAGNWSDIAHWQISTDGGATFSAATGAPGPVDNVYFTSSSFPSGGTITIDQPTAVTNMTWQAGSGITNPEIFGDWPNVFTIRGDLTMDNGVRRQIRSLHFDSSGGINNISMADNYDSYGDIVFKGGGTWNLLDSLYGGASTVIRDGTLNTNNNALASRFGLVIESDLSVINFGSSNVYLWDGFYNYATTPTLDFGTSILHFGNESNGTTRIRSTQSVTNFNEVRVFSPLQIQDNNVFEKLSVVPAGELILENGSTQTINSELSLLGSRSQLVKISSINPGLQATLSVTGATISADYIDIQDNNIDNGIASDVSATNTVDNGNNTGWTLDPLSALDLYWIGGSGSFTDPTHWSYTDGGEANIDGFAPGALDNAIFTSNSFPDIGQVTINQPVSINNMTWEAGSGLNNPVIYGDYNNTLTIQGNLTMDNGVNRRIYGLRIDSSIGTNQVDLADNFNAQGDIRFIGGGVSNLISDVATRDVMIVQEATLNTNNFTLDLGSFNFEGDNSVLNLGSSDVYIGFSFNDYGNAPVLNAGTSTIYFTTEFNNNGRIDGNETLNFNNIEITGNIQIQGPNTYNSFLVKPGSTISLFANRTQTINSGGTLDITGTRSGLVTLESYDFGTPGRGIFNVTGATVTADFIRIKDNIIDNGSVDLELATNAIDLGNNIGWDYSPISALDFYWVNGPGNWTDITHWSLTADGSTPATDPPGAVDNVFFTDTSFPEGGVLSFDVKPEVYNMTWEPGSGANFPILQENGQNNELIINGSLQMANGVTRSFYRLNFASDDMGNTIAMADNLYGYGDIDFTGSGEWTLLDSLATNY